jgi:hypothetical protein
MGAEGLFIILGKSFIYRRTSMGPRTEPCGTLAQLETLLLISLLLYTAVLQYMLYR